MSVTAWKEVVVACFSVCSFSRSEWINPEHLSQVFDILAGQQKQYFQNNKQAKTNSMTISLQANFTDRETATAGEFSTDFCG
jgi:hypothetical protein